MQTVLIVIHLMVVLVMVGLVLLQRSEGGGLGMGGGGGGFLTNRGSSNVLTRSTAILAGVFFVTSLMLSILAGYDRKPTSILNTGGAPAGTSPAPAGAPQPPLSQGGGVLDQLRRQGEQPSQGPQVPRSQ